MSGMIEWLGHKELLNKYPSYHVTFENAIREQWDDSDFEVECVFEELFDVDESELWTKIRNGPHFNQTELNKYITELISNLKEYAADNIDFDVDQWNFLQETDEKAQNNINNINIKDKDKYIEQLIKENKQLQKRIQDLKIENKQLKNCTADVIINMKNECVCCMGLNRTYAFVPCG
eukprot:437873_1